MRDWIKLYYQLATLSETLEVGEGEEILGRRNFNALAEVLESCLTHMNEQVYDGTADGLGNMLGIE
jgi:hypothetical protein